MIFPNKTSYAAGQPFVVRSLAVLTSSYVAGNIASFDEHNLIGLEVTYEKGDETTVEIKVEDSIDGGVTYGQEVAKAVSGGTTSITPNIYKLTPGDFSSGAHTISFNITPVKGDHVRISAKATGGTPTGKLGIRLLFGWA